MIPSSTIIPRAAASACVFRGETVLLVQRGKAPYAGAWNLPGGSIEPGETALQAATRETFEETGLTCTLSALAGINDVIVHDDTGALTHHYLIAVYCGLAPVGEPIAGDDASAARFVTMAELPDMGVAAHVRALIGAAYDQLQRAKHAPAN